jgi:hypothetical protein
MALGGRNISAGMLDELDLDAAAAMPAVDLMLIQGEIAAASALWKARNDALQAALDIKYRAQAGAARLAKGVDTGTVHLDDGELEIDCELRKKVEWDQPKLEALWSRIAAAADDPAVYMQRELKIGEAVYNSWPEKVSEAFKPARTVKPEKPKYTITIKSEEKSKRGRR